MSCTAAKTGPDASGAAFPSSQSRSPKRLAGACVGTASLAVIVAGMAALPRDGAPVAILGAAADARLVAAIGMAGGALVSMPSQHVTIAMPGDPLFVSRLRQLGYFLILDAGAVAGCATSNSRSGADDANQS